MSKGSFISPEQRSGIRARVEPIALAMARAGLTPNMLTLIGFGIASLGGLMAALEWWLLAGIVATAGAGFDMFDGAVARATGTGQPAGGLHGQHLRPLGRGCRLRGHRHRLHAGRLRPGRLALGGRAGLGLHGQLLASPRARAWASRAGTGMAAIGFAPREVRTVILGVALVGAGLLGGVTPDLADLGSLVLAPGWPSSPCSRPSRSSSASASWSPSRGTGDLGAPSERVRRDVSGVDYAPHRRSQRGRLRRRSRAPGSERRGGLPGGSLAPRAPAGRPHGARGSLALPGRLPSLAGEASHHPGQRRARPGASRSMTAT